jgi:hypothetical protein
MFAAENGHFDCLKYLHETAKAPWNSQAVRRAHENIHPDCVQYLLDNDCPLPDGWSYEDGELYSSEEEKGDYDNWEEVMEYWADPEDWDEFMEHLYDEFYGM